MDDCRCIKATESGNTSQNGKYSTKKQGSELRQQKYFVQPKQNCEKCSEHDCNPMQCDRCEDCEYTTKTFGTRTTEGCFDKSFQKSASEQAKAEKAESVGRPYLDGDKPTENHLIVVPHYKFWDPSATRNDEEPGADAKAPWNILRHPYQNRAEPLSKDKWLSQYPETAPSIQLLMDKLRSGVVWAGSEKNSETIDCGQDILGRLMNFKAARRECKDMQATVDQLKRAPNSKIRSRMAAQRRK